MKTQTNKISLIAGASIFVSIFCAASALMAADPAGQEMPVTSHRLAPASDATNDDKLIDEYIKAKGYQYVISFDASNIKQYWVDNSVFAKDDLINILLQKNESEKWQSVPLNIQLANITESMECTVSVIAKEPVLDFFVLNNKKKAVSFQKNKDEFVGYNVTSASFFMDDVPSSLFSLEFRNSDKDMLSLKRIVMSFAKKTKDPFLKTHGILSITKENAKLVNTALQEGEDFIVKGTSSGIFSQNNIVLSDTPINSVLTVKNTGDNPTRIYIGYTLYNKDGQALDKTHFPYNRQKSLKVVSAEVGNNTIIVESCPEWIAGCHIALDAKEDYSDIPNTNLLPETVSSVSETADKQAAIVLNKPLSKEIEKGSFIRLTSPTGGRYLYVKTPVVQPGEETVINASIARKNGFWEYSNKAFPQGTYYVLPLVLSNSVDMKLENTVEIKDFIISY